MKKSLLALAVLGAFVGVAHAQTNVTLYGLVDVGVTSLDDGDERTLAMTSGNNGASRWGIKGTEDLGSGLKASFVLEQGFEVDSGLNSRTNSSFGRLAYVGLGGNFGEIRLGRQNTQVKELMGDIDPFGAAGIANGHDFVNSGMDQRRDNQLTYMTPKFGGFTGGISYGFGEVPGDTSLGRNWGVRAGYANGPINVQAVYDVVNDAATDEDTKDAIVGATYNFGMAKLHALYGQRKVDGGDDYRTGLLGVTVPFGASAVRAEYIRLQNRDSDADSDVVALSYTYSLSKRTSLYATYVRADNDDGATLGLGGGDFPPAAGEDTASAFTVGVAHKF